MKLHLGCGKRNFGNGWVHIDATPYDHVEYSDIINLEFDNNSVDLIYASHVISYFDRHEISYILSKWKEVLKPSGILRLAVPDFEAISKLYISNSIRLHNFLGPLYGRMESNGTLIYHKTTYDFEELHRLLTESGFKNVMKYDWKTTDHSSHDDHSQAYIPHMDKENGTLISLNVQCEK